MDDDAMNPSAGHYNDSNRAFLQSLMARGTLTVEEGQELLAAIFSVHEDKEVTIDEVTQADLDSYIAAAAEAISPFDYEIRSTQDQQTKKRIYAIVNSVSDPITQLATTRSTDEILYIKRLIDAIFETNNTQRREIMAISSMEALTNKVRKGTSRQSDGATSTQSADKGLTTDQAEKLLANLVVERWLERSKAGYYTLSPRALIELRSWLIDAYNDSDDPDEWQHIKFCEACREIITIGQRCADLNCNVRLHNICQAAYFNSRPSKNCPKCGAAWDGKRLVGEKVVTASEEYLKGKRRSGQKRATQDEEGLEDMEEEQESSMARSIHRKNGHNKKSRATPEEEDAEDAEEEIEPKPNVRKSRRRVEPDPTPSASDDE